MTELAKKIALTHAIGSMQRLFPAEYAFYPKSWFLPAHYDAFQVTLDKNRRKRRVQTYYRDERERRIRTGRMEDMWFIVKPDEGAQGTGIYLIRSPAEIVDPSQRQLIQVWLFSLEYPKEYRNTWLIPSS